MKTQLLSPRFASAAAGRCAVSMSASQQEQLGVVRRRLESGELRLVRQPCPCQLRAEDVQIAEIDRYGLPLDSMVCLSCGTVRIDPYVDDKSLESFYRQSYQDLYGRNKNVLHLFDYQRVHYGERVAELYRNRLNKDSAVLEVGCGTGGATLAFRELGCFVAGCDFSSELVEYGRSQGVEQLWTGSIDDGPADLSDRKFDLIYLFHVLEHVSQPQRMLEQLRSRLTSGGCLLAVVPDISRIDAHRNPAGDALKFLHIAHKFNYSHAGLASVARQSGLEARQVMPPFRDETTLGDARHLSEMWVEFVPASADAMVTRPHIGQSMLDYLVETERRFLVGQCLAQRQIAGRIISTETKLSSSRKRRWYDRLPLVRTVHRYWKQAKSRAA